MLSKRRKGERGGHEKRSTRLSTEKKEGKKVHHLPFLSQRGGKETAGRKMKEH